MTKHTIELTEFATALEVPPQVMEWTTAGVRTFDLFLPPSHREHRLRIEMQPLEITDERAIVTITAYVYTVVNKRRALAVGQCASLVALCSVYPVALALGYGNAGNVASRALLSVLAGWFLGRSFYKNWRG